MALMKRKLEGQDISIRVELLDRETLQINARDNLGTVIWARHTTSGKEAIEIFWHPYAYGLEDRIHYDYIGESEAVEVS